MKKNKLILILVTLCLTLFSYNYSFSQNVKNDEEPIFDSVEVSPEFQGGQEALSKFLSKNIKYPNLARENDTWGTVFVTFVVKKDGTLENIKILRGIGDGCDEEVIRVTRLMPKWIPGKQNGKNVAVQYNLPIRFNLTDEKKDKRNKKIKQ